MRGVTDITNHVKILRQQQQVHDFLSRRSVDISTEINDTALQAINYGLALLGYTDTRQILGLCFSLCGLCDKISQRRYVG